ncbi:MAG TPA: hypothetical protein VHI52_14000, partial [Verrucomicrobiae bacterium]|nr:hypothetical protein [Verrucomicrobiae bacterium]
GQSDGDAQLFECVTTVAKAMGDPLKTANHLLLQRGPYTVAAGLDESVDGGPKVLSGRLIDLFDSELRVQQSITLTPGSRFVLLDLNRVKAPRPRVLASACKTLVARQDKRTLVLNVEGVAGTPAVVLVAVPGRVKPVAALSGAPPPECDFSPENHLAWIRFTNESIPRELVLNF